MHQGFSDASWSWRGGITSKIRPPTALPEDALIGVSPPAHGASGGDDLAVVVVVADLVVHFVLLAVDEAALTYLDPSAGDLSDRGLFASTHAPQLLSIGQCATIGWY